MAFLRAIAYFVSEAATSLWRSRLVNAVSIGTIAVSLFVLGAFLTVASGLGELVTRWTEKVQVIVYLEDGTEDRVRASLENRLREDPAVGSVDFVSREEALRRFREMFRDLSSLPEDLGENPFPASLEVTLAAKRQSPAEVERLAKAFTGAPGVREIQYDLLWIERLATGVRLVRGLGAFLGGILVLAGIFTISNVIRLTIYAREDELDIMRLVGATKAYVKGPFVAEGVIQGGLGGLVAAGLLWGALAWLSQGLASSDLLGRTAFSMPAVVALLLVAGGMAVGLVGSLISLARWRSRTCRSCPATRKATRRRLSARTWARILARWRGLAPYRYTGTSIFSFRSSVSSVCGVRWPDTFARSCSSFGKDVSTITAFRLPTLLTTSQKRSVGAVSLE